MLFCFVCFESTIFPLCRDRFSCKQRIKWLAKLSGFTLQYYRKISKLSKTFLFKMLFRIANREDLGQTKQSYLGMHCVSALLAAKLRTVFKIQNNSI